MNRPNLFVVGSMKCGTTILCDFLSMHPEVAIARGKETHYFTLNADKGVDWYLAHFDGAGDVRYRVDASPTYFDLSLFAHTPQAIKAFAPEAKIVVMIRDPLERALSHFRHFQTVNRIPALDGRSFADLVGEDWTDAIVAQSMDAFLKYQILHFSAYARKIQDWVRVFGGDSVLVVNNADLRAHGGAVMDSVFGFLGLDPVEADFSVERYLGGTRTTALPASLRLKVYRTFGADWFAANTMAGPARPAAPAGATFSEPRRAIVNDVAVGRDGWLFLAEGSNRTVDLFLDTGGITSRLVPGWRTLLSARAARFARDGIRYLHAFVPEKLSIHTDAAELGLDPRTAPATRLWQAMSEEERGSVCYLHDYLRRQARAYPVFWKTDSHWSGVGAYSAYEMIMSRLGLPARRDLLDRPSRSAPALMDLGARLPTRPREEVRYHAFRQEARVVEEGELVAYKRRHGLENEASLHVGSLMMFENPAAPQPQSVLLFGDSFSEYRDHLLTGLLAETFRRVTFAWSTSVDHRLVAETRPDIVLTVHTERFMTRVPGDDFDVRRHAATMVAARVADAPAA